MKKKIIFTIIIVNFLLTIFLLTYFLNKNRSRSITGPIFNYVKYKQEQTLKENKVISIYLKKEVLDTETDAFTTELNKINGVNGFNVLSKHLQKDMEDINSLYPENLNYLTPGSHIVIDIYLENADKKISIAKEIKKLPQVEVVIDLSPQSQYKTQINDGSYYGHITISNKDNHFNLNLFNDGNFSEIKISPQADITMYKTDENGVLPSNFADYKAISLSIDEFIDRLSQRSYQFHFEIRIKDNQIVYIKQLYSV
jgi:hypothetical protein